MSDRAAALLVAIATLRRLGPAFSFTEIVLLLVAMMLKGEVWHVIMSLSKRACEDPEVRLTVSHSAFHSKKRNLESSIFEEKIAAHALAAN